MESVALVRQIIVQILLKFFFLLLSLAFRYYFTSEMAWSHSALISSILKYIWVIIDLLQIQNQTHH